MRKQKKAKEIIRKKKSPKLKDTVFRLKGPSTMYENRLRPQYIIVKS